MMTLNVIMRLCIFLCLLSEVVYGGYCRYPHKRCSIDDSIKELFPLTTDPTYNVLKRSDNHGGVLEFPQLANYVDNDVSDFSWDKVFWMGENSVKINSSQVTGPRVLSGSELTVSERYIKAVLWYSKLGRKQLDRRSPLYGV